ncbi:hypothetical protein HJFPF1_00254 [Paramyrothecium foliicola]|nr:hypothetical protein HJFPF1_00254 [Paramyrothecium foliicola]
MAWPYGGSFGIVFGESESIGVFTGALLNHNVPNFISFVDHIFVGDTIDGGATPWLTNINPEGVPARRWKGARNKSEELFQIWPPLSQLPNPQKRPLHEPVAIRCHCKGVNLSLRSVDVSIPNESIELPWFIDPRYLKHQALFDACDPCRNAFGIDIVHWTFVLLEQLHFAGAEGLQHQNDDSFPRDSIQLKNALSSANRDPRLGTLAMYASSPDVQRYFCSRCGASIFYAVDDRPEMINVAVGLLDDPEGARAESLLMWSFGSALGHSGDVRGGWREKYADTVQRNAEAWRLERGYPVSYKRFIAENTQ